MMLGIVPKWLTKSNDLQNLICHHGHFVKNYTSRAGHLSIIITHSSFNRPDINIQIKQIILSYSTCSPICMLTEMVPLISKERTPYNIKVRTDQPAFFNIHIIHINSSQPTNMILKNVKINMALSNTYECLGGGIYIRLEGKLLSKICTRLTAQVWKEFTYWHTQSV